MISGFHYNHKGEWIPRKGDNVWVDRDDDTIRMGIVHRAPLTESEIMASVPLAVYPSTYVRTYTVMVFGDFPDGSVFQMWEVDIDNIVERDEEV